MVITLMTIDNQPQRHNSDLYYVFANQKYHHYTTFPNHSYSSFISTQVHGNNSQSNVNVPFSSTRHISFFVSQAFCFK